MAHKLCLKAKHNFTKKLLSEPLVLNVMSSAVATNTVITQHTLKSSLTSQTMLASDMIYKLCVNTGTTWGVAQQARQVAFSNQAA